MEEAGQLLVELPTVAGRFLDEDIGFGLAGHLHVLRIPLECLAGLLGGDLTSASLRIGPAASKKGAGQAP